jgi:enamine deaminase RidA (YjgF/YER057c/UK114 family)
MTEDRSPGTDALFRHAPYDYGTLVAQGAIVFTAGACPLDPDGVVVAPGDHAVQAAVAVQNLALALARFGARLEHLVKTTVYVVGERRDLVAVWDVVAEALAPHRPPSTLLGVSVLGYPDQLVEIEGVAVIPDATS